MYIAFLFFILTATTLMISLNYIIRCFLFILFFYFKSPKLFNQLKNKKIKQNLYQWNLSYQQFVALMKVAKFFMHQTVSYAVKIMNKNFWCGDPH